jgi:hypothetical protein
VYIHSGSGGHDVLLLSFLIGFLDSDLAIFQPLFRAGLGGARYGKSQAALFSTFCRQFCDSERDLLFGSILEVRARRSLRRPNCARFPGQMGANMFSTDFHEFSRRARIDTSEGRLTVSQTVRIYDTLFMPRCRGPFGTFVAPWRSLDHAERHRGVDWRKHFSNSVICLGGGGGWEFLRL